MLASIGGALYVVNKIFSKNNLVNTLSEEKETEISKEDILINENKELEKNIIEDLFNFFEKEHFYIKSFDDYRVPACCDKNGRLKYQQIINREYWEIRGYNTFLLEPEKKDLKLKDFFPEINYIRNISTLYDVEVSIKNLNKILEKLNKTKNDIKNNQFFLLEFNRLITSWEDFKNKVESLIN